MNKICMLVKIGLTEKKCYISFVLVLTVNHLIGVSL